MSIEDGGMTAVTRDGVNYGIYNDLGTRFTTGNGFMTSSFNLQATKFKKDLDLLIR